MSTPLAPNRRDFLKFLAASPLLGVAARALHPLVTRGAQVRNTEFVKFFSHLPPYGEYAPLQIYLLRALAPGDRRRGRHDRRRERHDRRRERHARRRGRSAR